MRSETGVPEAVNSAAFATIRSLIVRHFGSNSGWGAVPGGESGGTPVSVSIRWRSKN
ncbi:hypothetical protein [Streptomyces sp. NPDC007264]|uniref:hypothetical protein n=1 Tax=Streptomyces sp. NPDC007264 TaxID=3364777 RepID=UPI0036DCCB74